MRRKFLHISAPHHSFAYEGIIFRNLPYFKWHFVYACVKGHGKMENLIKMSNSDFRNFPTQLNFFTSMSSAFYGFMKAFLRFVFFFVLRHVCMSFWHNNHFANLVMFNFWGFNLKIIPKSSFYSFLSIYLCHISITFRTAEKKVNRRWKKVYSRVFLFISRFF